MLILEIPSAEMWDEIKEEFVSTPPTVLKLEHSLVSIEKWEKIHKKAFLGKKEKTVQEMIDYIKCMTLTQNVKDEVYAAMTPEIIEKVLDYMEDRQSAFYMREPKDGPKNKDVPVSELIYYWMIQNGIPFECNKWNFNRLMNLIRLCNVKNAKANGSKSRRGLGQIAGDYASLNAARKAKHHSKG